MKTIANLSHRRPHLFNYLILGQVSYILPNTCGDSVDLMPESKNDSPIRTRIIDTKY